MAVEEEDNAIIEPASFTRAKASTRRRRPYLRPWSIALVVLFLVLAAAVAFMFTASAVRFTVTPIPDRFEVTRGLFTYQLGERYLMLPGKYRIRAELEGYEPLERQIEVTSGSDQDFAFDMTKLPGILTVTTTPDVAAEVHVDQEAVGTTPLTLRAIAPGLHDIAIIAERYLRVDTDIDIEGKRIEQSLEVPLEPAWAEVVITSTPAEGSVVVDGQQRATTPAQLELLQGEHVIQVKKPGYKTWQTTLDVVAGEPVSLPDARLIRADGKVSVNTEPSGANVTIGGRYRGQSPVDVTLRPGEAYEVVLSKAGYQSAKRTIDVDPDEDIALSTRLEPIVGVVRLMVEPGDGELFVDGQSKGLPNQRLELTARSHEIEIHTPGYATYATTVTPKPGLSQQLMIQLETEAEAKVAAINESLASAGGPRLQLILPGELEMGAGRREPGRRSNEIEKSVKLTRPYYLSVHEITNAQYKKFAPNHESGVLGRTLLGQEERPVVNVSWQDAARYCNWLSKQDGLPPAYEMKAGRLQAVQPMTTGYRLPTEAEWAWAARYAGGEPTRFPWGDRMPPEEVHANYADESARAMVPYHVEGYNDTFRGPAPVGSFEPNEFGIFDLAGNVSEWIHDY
ncbi:MAG: PEGA domain-containing protein [Gammaproteobacteria bacterium]|nr:PEGA domain-containing protein [Gammaproteobacteria bacterium]